MFNVVYIDDFKQKHLIVVNSIQELNFIKERFENVKITPLEKI